MLQRFQNRIDPDSVFLLFFLGLQLPDHVKLFQEVTKLCGQNYEARFSFASYQFVVSHLDKHLILQGSRMSPWYKCLFGGSSELLLYISNCFPSILS